MFPANRERPRGPGSLETTQIPATLLGSSVSHREIGILIDWHLPKVGFVRMFVTQLGTLGYHTRNDIGIPNMFGTYPKVYH